jgi:hypothetical protein
MNELIGTFKIFFRWDLYEKIIVCCDNIYGGGGIHFRVIVGSERGLSTAVYTAKHNSFSRRVDPLTGKHYPLQTMGEGVGSEKRRQINKISESLQAKLDGRACESVVRATKITVCLPSSEKKTKVAKLGATIIG